MPAWDPLRGDAPGTNPNYLRTFEARVQKVLDDWILLDRTAFYAEGGGQPSDRGLLTWDGGEARVVSVTKRGAVKHVLEGERPPPGTLVRGEIDWDLRHKHMRNHTSQHILSAMVWKTRRVGTVGNQIGAEGSRVDFATRFDASALKDLENAVNAVFAKDLPIRIYEEDRTALERRSGDRALLSLVPASVKRLRVVEVIDPAEGDVVDVCPCAGTHVMRTGEVGRMEILGRESKGADADRVSYLLRQP